jgi:hypothetical protein
LSAGLLLLKGEAQWSMAQLDVIGMVMNRTYFAGATDAGAGAGAAVEGDAAGY